MKTDFKLLWPWASFNSHVEDMTWWTIGFPTQIDFSRHKPSGEWHFEVQILGVGFYVERYLPKVVREATNDLLKAVERKNGEKRNS